MRKWLPLLFTLFLIFPAAVHAQNAITLDSLDVRLWAEYDQPSMLVIYDFEPTANTTLPASINIRIPKDANITAVASQEGNGLVNAEFTGPVEDGSWQTITVIVKALTTYHIEYYQTIKHDAGSRSFTYLWTGDYPVNNLKVEIQLPGDSTAVRASPMLPFVPNQPFLSGSAALSNLAAGKTYQVDLHYSRLSESPVMPASTSQAASEPITRNTAGRVTLNNLPYILGGVGVLLIISAIYYFWRSNLNHVFKPRKRQQSTRDEKEPVYCHECGTRAHADDRFCRTCGSRLRIE
jgi:hypothetical protein